MPSIDDHVEGKVVVEAADGGVLLLGRDGRLWSVTPKQKRSPESAGRPFSLLSADELGRTLLKESLGPNFEIVKTRHYVIATGAGTQYAEWCGDLFERLLDAFLTHWRSKGLALAEPAGPLPAIIFPDEHSFKAYASADAGQFGEESKGYYSIRTNRIVLYDLTAGKGKKRATSDAEIKRRHVGGRLQRRHYRARGDASNRLQLRIARAVRRQSALAHRRHGDVFRDARSRRRPRLANDRADQSAAVQSVPQLFAAAGRAAIRSRR